MNLDLAASGGAVLVVSQFTLHADTSRGPPAVVHPSGSSGSGGCSSARSFVAAFRGLGHTVETGRFGAHMDVELVNDGPVTLVLTSGEPDWPADAG